MEVHYLDRQDVAAFQAEVSEAMQVFVRRARRLGEEVAWASVGAALAGLSERDSAGRIIRGIDYVTGGFFPTARPIETEVGLPLIAGAVHSFPACGDTVRVVANQAGSEPHQVNLTFVEESR